MGVFGDYLGISISLFLYLFRRSALLGLCACLSRSASLTLCSFSTDTCLSLCSLRSSTLMGLLCLYRHNRSLSYSRLWLVLRCVFCSYFTSPSLYLCSFRMNALWGSFMLTLAHSLLYPCLVFSMSDLWGLLLLFRDKRFAFHVLL